jgi:sugar/nucleoside kinase (ribokinase family)
MKKFEVITIGGATRDIFFVSGKGRIIKTPENLKEKKLLGFEYGAKIKSDEVYFSVGGGASNLAVGLSRLGISAVPFVFIGNDENGEAVLSNFVRERVSVSLIKRLEEKRTGFSFILMKKDTKEHVAFLYRGANDYLKVAGYQKRIMNTDWIYLAALYGEAWEENTEAILKLVKEKKMRLAYNPGTVQVAAGYKKFKEILKYTEVFVLNRDEAVELCLSEGKEIKDDPAWLVKKLLKEGPKVVVVTDGRRGAWVGNQAEAFCASSFKGLKEKDTTGAGDAFGAGFLAGYIKNEGSLEKALQYGLVNSGSVVSEVGTQEGLLRENKILGYLDQVKVKKC